VQLLPGLITDDFAYKDTVWAVRRPVVGAAAFRGYVEAMRTAYPDLMYEIQQVGGGPWRGARGGEREGGAGGGGGGGGGAKLSGCR
jgi:hypothetical protein